jgi:hypothetical protein
VTAFLTKAGLPPMGSRAHHLGRLDRTALITLYQQRKRYDAFEVARMDRDQLITAILDHEDR